MDRKDPLLRFADRLVTPQNRLRRALSPAYSALLNALSGGRGYPVDINGEAFRIDPRFRWTAGQDYEREIAAFLADRIKPGQTCFDIGANVGVYVLQISRWSAPGGSIVAFEPNPSTLPVLRRHIAMNGLESRVTVVPKAVGSGRGTAALFDDTAGSGLSRIGGSHPGLDGAVTQVSIEVITIDDYCRETGMVPDWMLIDVEGYEYEVLQGAADTLRRHAPRVVLELHPHVISAASRESGERLLRDLGLTAVPIGAVHGRTETFVSLEPKRPSALTSAGT